MPVGNFALEIGSRSGDERRHQTCGRRGPFAGLSPIHYRDLGPRHCVTFIKFHFTFLQQHSRRRSFCRFLGHFPVGLAADVHGPRRPSASSFLCCARIMPGGGGESAGEWVLPRRGLTEIKQSSRMPIPKAIRLTTPPPPERPRVSASSLMAQVRQSKCGIAGRQIEFAWAPRAGADCRPRPRAASAAAAPIFIN
ncbi:hypothetical protein EVAR_18844_1 [Eumeta japonica]|uniref:Uncharacterized protein n=1 Tax=Eumeta variegata TaxID=151549 RepID=A0A4C1UMP4_EUMVA|nr:hypothetical protein EVAR_18844_1 [Eumeta japonica]